MTKWADYLISKVQYNQDHTHIIKVLQHEDTGESVGIGYEKSRLDVIQNLKNNKSYYTIKKNNGNWNRGDNVIYYHLEGEYYIRTDGNKTKSDNLGELPEF